jgi:hypothetical protein
MYATLSTTRDVLSGGGGGAVASNGATDQPRRASSAPTRRRTPFSSIYRPADVPAAFESGVLLCLMVERLRGEVERERAAVVAYLTWRAEMTHYNDAAREFVNAAQEVSDGVHHTIDYDEEEP